jgi:hypothetical protein
MFCFAVINKDTGDIEHCFVDNGDGDIDFQAMIEKGEYPIRVEPELPSHLDYAVIAQDALADALADEKVARFTNDRAMIANELREARRPTWDAARIREEIRVFAAEKRDNGGELHPCRIEVRVSRGRMDLKTGAIQEGGENEVFH